MKYFAHWLTAFLTLSLLVFLRVQDGGMTETLRLKGFDYLQSTDPITVSQDIVILEIDEKAIELYITRSWATVSNGKENILKHKHQQSHISFAYYLKKNNNDSNLIFFAENFQN